MKKKIAIIVIIIVMLLIGVSLYIVTENKEKVQEVISKSNEIVEPIEPKSNFIWIDNNDDNTWVCFRKKVTLTEVEAEKVVAQIGADSKYWLYINGEQVIRDGALKRGEKKNSIYYDEIDLSKYFHSGENTIAILSWYWGGRSFSHISSGQAGMFFQAKAGENWIITDNTWKAAKHEAFQKDGIVPNYRLAEHNVYYDASLWNEEWYKENYDDSSWANAKVLNVIGALPWGELIKREIPQFKDGDVKEYENMQEYAGHITSKNETIELKLPYNAQFTPYLKVEAEKGKEINVKTDTFDDPAGASLRFSYITKDGVQEFESPAWINGEKAYYTFEEGVKIISLGYRETGYDTELVGNFESDDEFLNKLWKQVQRSLYVNMRDSYMDCPNRERAQWMGDMNWEMMEAMYSLDTNANALYEKGIKTTIGWKDEDVLFTVSPNDWEPMHLPVQVLSGIVTMYDYYEYTGKTEFIEYVYPYAKNYLGLWKINPETNLAQWNSSKEAWKWGDSVGENDYTAIENACYYYAMAKTKQMAELLKNEQDVADFNEKLSSLSKGFNNLWTEKGYKTGESKIIDERANAIAVISGLAGEEKYPIIKEIFKTSFQSTPYMEKYILEALCEMGEYEEAQNRIKNRYKDMVEGENSCSTVWEHWDFKRGTKNHAWSGGPLIIMSKYFAGIEPLKAGYEEISINPNFGNLKNISSIVETIKGKITMEAKRENEQFEMTLSVPTKTLITIPRMGDNDIIKINEKVVYKNGKKKFNFNFKIKYFSEDENNVYFYVNAGDYTVKTEKNTQNT